MMYSIFYRDIPLIIFYFYDSIQYNFNRNIPLITFIFYDNILYNLYRDIPLITFQSNRRCS